MGEYANSGGRWTANLNPNEPVELTFVPDAIPTTVLSSISTDNIPLLSYAANQDLDQRLANNRPSSSRLVDLMRNRPDTPIPHLQLLQSQGLILTLF